MPYVRMIITCLVFSASCKSGGSWSWSSSGGTTTPSSSSSPSGASPDHTAAAAQIDTGNRDKDYSEIGNDIGRAQAWYKQYVAAEIKNACGIDVALTIDFPSFKGADYSDANHIVGEQYCGVLGKSLANICSTPTGKAAVRELKAFHCERLIGKANKGGAKMFESDGNKHAYEYSNGKLTLKLGANEPNHWYFKNALEKQLWPVVPWQRDVDAFIGSLQKHFTNWSEDKDGVELTVDIDPKGFATVNYMWAFYTCGGNGNSNEQAYSRSYPGEGHLAKFLDLVYATDKGKKLLRKVKRITCSATPDPKGRTAELVGDRLIYYGRVLEEHHKASWVSGFAPNRIPEYDAYFSFGLFRKAHNLDGKCEWPRIAFEKDPEAERFCPRD